MANAIKNRLMHYFGVNTYKELTEFIQNNPSDRRVVALRRLLKDWGVNFKNRKTEEEGELEN